MKHIKKFNEDNDFGADLARKVLRGKEIGYIEFERTQKVKVYLKRDLTDEEIQLVHDNMFELPEDAIDWNDEEVIDSDHFNEEVYIKGKNY